MKIETKYNIGDKTYTIQCNRVICFTIERIDVKVSEKEISIKYISKEKVRQLSLFSNGYEDLPLYIDEKQSYSSKEELLKSL